MACETLTAIGYGDDVDAWARRFARVSGTVVAAIPDPDFDWSIELGDYRHLAEWIGLFEQAIAAQGWPAVVETSAVVTGGRSAG
jgi:hypothetical protein